MPLKQVIIQNVTLQAKAIQMKKILGILIIGLSFITGISGQEGRIYDCSPPANISKFEFSRDVFF